MQCRATKNRTGYDVQKNDKADYMLRSAKVEPTPLGGSGFLQNFVPPGAHGTAAWFKKLHEMQIIHKDKG